MRADKIEIGGVGYGIALRRSQRNCVSNLFFIVIILLYIGKFVPPRSGSIGRNIHLMRLVGNGICQRNDNGIRPYAILVFPIIPGNGTADRNGFRIERSRRIKILDQGSPHFFRCRNHIVIDVQIIP